MLQDELLAALFTLAAVDFLAFYNNLLPGFLIQIADLSDEQKRQLAEKITLEKVSIIHSCLLLGRFHFFHRIGRLL